MTALSDSSTDMREEIFKKISETVADFGEIILCYVFGSVVKGEDFRDVDVALLLEKDLSPPEELRFALKVARIIERAITPRREVEVVVLNKKPVELQYEVVRTGVPVFVRDEVKRVNYEADLASLYLDFKSTVEWFDREFLKW